MNPHAFYLREVLPRLESRLERRYPHIRLSPSADCLPLGDVPLPMLVGLTGCGKSTTLALLGAGGGIPSRREVADCVAIPFAQILAGEALNPVQDRARRFALTRQFAKTVPGGMATAFSWLQLRRDCRLSLLTEGLRGDVELRHALRHFPRWQVIELALPPLTRLRRLSNRQDQFDQADGAARLDFLPLDMRDKARALLDAGEITRRALAIMRAEARNYGVHAFDDGARYANYQRLDVAGMRPELVASAVREMLALPCP